MQIKGGHMPLNFFKTVDTYGAMLNKLATANIFVGLLAFYFLSSQCPELKSLADGFTLDISIAGIKLPAGYIVPPIGMAIFFRVIKLHDRISDIFKIRSYYDWTYVLEPMKQGVQSDAPKDNIMTNRGSLMSKVFYRYASSRDANSIVDKHLIEMVLDQLTWYWMIIETSFITFIVFIALMYTQSFEHALVLFYLGLGLIIFAKILQSSCSKYTAQEVNIILDTAPRKREIKEQFDAI
jgi:hypothetical protein